MAVRADHSLSSVKCRTCTKCKAEKPVDQFYKRTDRPNHLKSECKVCRAARSKTNTENNRGNIEWHRRRRHEKFVYLYGITLEEYNAMVFQQHGLCKCCGNTADPLCVDHDHSTGKVRALLCSNCNTAMGLINESAKRCEQLLAYIYSHAS